MSGCCEGRWAWRFDAPPLRWLGDVQMVAVPDMTGLGCNPVPSPQFVCLVSGDIFSGTTPPALQLFLGCLAEPGAHTAEHRGAPAHHPKRLFARFPFAPAD